MVAKLARTRNTEVLSAAYDWKAIESKVRGFYEKPSTRQQISLKVGKGKPLGYVEGPPTLNNQPHIGHVRGRIMKDLWYRNRTLAGDNIVFRGGWDTQGLPVELQAEKELGLSGNKWEDLQKVGVDKLVEACKQLIGKYRKDWEEADRLLGLMIDREKAYMTYRDAYIEREWKYLETAWGRGLLGEGFKVVPYCPSCQTALSAGEVSLGGYQNLEDPSLYYKAKTSDGAFLVLWTTMPFTVVTDELVGVKPDSDYEYVSVGGETWVVCTERKEALEKELGVSFGPTVKKVKGKELEGLGYEHPLIDLIPGLKSEEFAGKVHKVVAEEYVDVTTGTGLVHMSPANGEEDFEVAKSRGVPVFAPFDDRVRFTPEAGRFSGLFARDADEVVVQSLREKGSLLKIGKILHEYPVCWRSDDRLVWLARREYFYWVERIRKDLVKAAGKVEYFFEGPKKRFLNGLAESPAWCITRERVWGTPLPVWVCEKCGTKTGAFSRQRIVELAESLPDGKDFELHRPWIDRVVLKCPKCGGRAFREPFVLDTWHNSGASPYASFSDHEYKTLVPVEWLTEAIDQTRGWAYTLLVLNIIMTGKPFSPYRAFLFQGHVLDEKGQKMSKSLGNVIQGLDFLRGGSVDVSRFYVISKASPEDSVSLDLKEMTGRSYQVINTLYHLHLYLAQNGKEDGYSPQRHTLEWATKSRLLSTVDRWLLAKLASAQTSVPVAYDRARYNEAARALEDLIISSVSQNYVRLVRGDLWKDDPRSKGRRLAIYSVLGEALNKADELLHPISPFATEYLFQEVFAAKPWKVSLLASGRRRKVRAPPGRSESIVDFALVVEEACNSARTKAKLKRRWPLRSLDLLVPRSSAKLAKAAKRTIASLCNVKEVHIFSSARDFPARFVFEPNTAKIGALFKERTKDVLMAAAPLEGDIAIRAYASGKALKLDARSGKVEVPSTAYQLTVLAREHYEFGERDGVFVAISKTRDDKLVAEGLMRDVARRLQALRKTKGFSPTAMLREAAIAGIDEEDLGLLRPLSKELAFLVRVRRVELSHLQTLGKKWVEEDLDGKPIFLDVG